MRATLYRQQHLNEIMDEHSKNDKIKYKKIGNSSTTGYQDFIFDSYGNPIELKRNQPEPKDIEIMKP